MRVGRGCLVFLNVLAPGVTERDRELGMRALEEVAKEPGGDPLD